jgi:arylsulfatase A-like enzyme
MKHIGKRIGMALLLAGIASGPVHTAPAEEQRRAEHVFIISFDGAGGEVIKSQPAPNFKRMFGEGAATWRAYTIVPSLTLPSHTSMLTGVGIQEHQIDWNNYMKERGPVRVPTIFSVAKQHGLTTAMFVGKDKLKHLNVPGSVDTFYLGGRSPDVAAAFAGQIAALKPNLCFIHFSEIDERAHKYGVGSPKQIEAIADSDASLKVIRDAVRDAGIEADSVFLLTADHGAHNNPPDQDGKITGTHGSSKRSDVEIPWVAWGKGVKKGFTISAPVLTYDTAATALWLLGVPVPESFWGKPVTSAFE